MTGDHIDTEQRKPVRELVESIGRRSATSDPRRGVVNPLLVDRIAFAMTLAALLLITAMLVAMIWGVVDVTIGFKWIGTILVVLVALLIFRSINEHFAE